MGRFFLQRLNKTLTKRGQYRSFLFGATFRSEPGPGFTATYNTHYDSSERVISSSQRPLPDKSEHLEQTDMSLVGFEPTISAGERQKTYFLDRADTGTGRKTRRHSPISSRIRTLNLRKKLSNLRNSHAFTVTTFELESWNFFML